MMPTRPAAGLLALALVAAACSSADPTGDGAAAVGDSTTTAFPEPEVPAGGPGAEFLALPLEGQVDEFLAEPNSVKGAAVAQAMGDTGAIRWGPWLLDLYRLGRSTRIDDAVVESFTALSGVEAEGNRTADYRNFGNWVYRESVDPGPGYRQWKLGLYGSIDEEFAELLSGIPDDVLLSQIQWGGVPRGGIPELNDPERVAASEATWMVDDESVLGVVVDGVAVAYPLRIMGHHELANDVIAGRPVSMIYCTLCRSGLLFDRRVGDQVLDFQTSGLLIESNKIMVDVQTDTLWRHQTGVGLAGELEGVELEQFPVTTTSWAEWIEEQPDSEVLAIPEPIFSDDPLRPPIVYDYEPGEAYRYYYEDPDVWFPVFDTPDVFALKDEVIGLSDGDDDIAVLVSAVAEAGPQVLEVGERLVAVVPTAGGARVYDVSGSALTEGPIAEPVDDNNAALTLADGTSWDRLVAPQLFWFAWFGQHPDTRWWPR